MMSKQLKVAIVGAGASGLPAIRHALAYGVQPVCFESANEVGGLWRYKPDHKTMSVYKTTSINTSKEMTAYSDFPPPAHFPNFMHNSQMLKYLEQYASHHQLYDHIRFNHYVKNIERAPSYKKDGKWIVTYKDEDNQQHQETYDGVIVATGHYTTPYMPAKFPGQDGYQGKIIHGSEYKDHKGYEDKTVAIVGIGNSGVDIAVDLSRIAKQVYLVTRRGTWVINKMQKYCKPYDMSMLSRFSSFCRKAMPFDLASRMMERKVTAKFDHEKFGLRPKHNIFSHACTITDDLAARLMTGTIRVKPNIKKFTPTGLIFEDGSSSDVEEVIMATGYTHNFPVAENGTLIPRGKYTPCTSTCTP